MYGHELDQWQNSCGLDQWHNGCGVGISSWQLGRTLLASYLFFTIIYLWYDNYNARVRIFHIYILYVMGILKGVN